MRTVILMGALAIGLTACATSPQSDPAYVSPTQYQGYNCKQISAEMQRVSTKQEQANQGAQANAVLNTALTAFAISQGYGVSQDDNSSVRRLNNQYEVLEQTAIQKECNLK